jgi:hypothetical protein
MSNDLVKRVRALLPAPPRDARPADPRLDPTQRKNELLARARAMLAAPDKAISATPPPPPAPEIVKLPMTCGQTGGAFVVISERCGDRLAFVGHEMPRTRQDAGEGRQLPELLSGQYHIDVKDDWVCPLCNNRTSQHIWICHCANFNGAMQCGSTHGRARYCACGKLEERQLVQAETHQVRGASVAATPATKIPGSQYRGHPQIRQVTYERRNR